MSKDTMSINGRVIFRDPETKEVLFEKNNLVVLVTKVFLMENLFKTAAPSSYKPGGKNAIYNLSRQISLLTIGSGGADNNSAPFAPHVPKFSDVSLTQAVPFKQVDPDKVNSAVAQADPSIVAELTETEKHQYYMPKSEPDGAIYYFGKRPIGATDDNPYGNSKGFQIDQNTGEVSFSLSFNIDSTDARGQYINELGLVLGQFDKSTNTYKDTELATRLTFDTESFASLTKSVEIEYIVYM